MALTREQAVALTSTPKREGSQYKGKCLICEKRPAKVGGFCAICHSQIEADRARRRKAKVNPVKFATWRGMTIEFYRNGNGTLKPVASKRDLEKLPKSKLIDLNKRVDGFTREQVKNLKRAILQVHKVDLPKVKV